MSYAIEDVLFAGFRFGCKINSDPKILRKLLLSFIENYSLKYILNDEDFKFFLTRCILNRICFILKNHFFKSSNYWIADLENQLNYLKLARKIFP